MLRIGADLTLRLGDEVVQLTPAEGLRAAEQLIRKSTRRMMIEEAFGDDPGATTRRQRRRPQAHPGSAN